MYQRYFILKKSWKQIGKLPFSQEGQIFFPLLRFPPARHSLKEMTVENSDQRLHLLDRHTAHREGCYRTERHFSGHGDIDPAQVLFRLFLILFLDLTHRRTIEKFTLQITILKILQTGIQSKLTLLPVLFPP